MKYPKFFTRFILLLTIPSFFVHSIPPLNFFHEQAEEAIHEESYNLNSYDNVLKLIDDLENGELEKKYTHQDLENLNSLLSNLAEQGMLPHEFEEQEILDNDIQQLINREDNTFQFACLNDHNYIFSPLLVNEHGEFLLCKSWLHKKWDQTKHFARKHKKALIIGAAVVVVATAVVLTAGALAAPAAAAAASGGAAAYESDKDKGIQASGQMTEDLSPELKTLVNDQVAYFKDNLEQNQTCEYTSMGNLEENTRIQSSLYAHQKINDQFAHEPSYTYNQVARAHCEVDKLFNTDCASLYDANQKTDATALFYQVRGERSFESGLLNEAVYDLGKSIEFDPNRPSPYLEKGFAHFELKNYDAAIEDYNSYLSTTKTPSILSIPEFSLGFCKGVPKGMYASGQGYCLLASDLVKHPIQTGMQMWEAINILSSLARSDEWSAISEALVPEVHQLIKEWETLPSSTRGELAGYALGKYGSDIIIPGALTKAITNGVKGAQKLSLVYSSLKTAEKTLLLESAAAFESSAQISEMVQATQNNIKLGNELGFGTTHMIDLKQAGHLENTLLKHSQIIARDPILRQSLEKFKKAEAFLKPHSKEFLTESQAKELIHHTRIRTFPRPTGIPEYYKVKISDRGAGMKYVHPTNPQLTVRVMPGKPHSPHPFQQKPYVIQSINGKGFDKYGNLVPLHSPKAHIPFNEFIYRK